MKFPTRVLLGAFAAFGTFAAHGLAFLLLAPDPHVRAQLLSNTGHRYWDLLAAFATGALVAGVAGIVLNHVSRHCSTGRAPGYRYAASRLAGVQAVVFVCLEVAERSLFAGGSHLGDGGIILLGVAVQVLVALALAGFVVGLDRVVGFLAGSPDRTSRARTPLAFVRVEGPGHASNVAREPKSSRGPPLRVGLST